VSNIFRLEQGRSYRRWLEASSAVFLGGFVICELLGVGWWGILMLPAEVALLVICQVRSGVALDSNWDASYARGTWQFRGLIAWEMFVAIFFVAAWYCVSSR
jgi:hypothetical protein